MIKKILLLKESLSLLPCFNHIETIEPIHHGLSHFCFKVLADNNTFFAKQIENKQVETKILNALITAKNNISPAIVFQNRQWLITTYISADNFKRIHHTIESKITSSIDLMAKFHQLNIKLPPLNLLGITVALINKDHYSPEQKKVFTQIGSILEKKIATLITKNKQPAVCCHGDLNFSNVLFSETTKQTWLVDFECSCYAPIEYDLAMFIAINNLNINVLPAIINQYERYQPITSIDQMLIKQYLLFCYFINGLWFFNHAELKSATEKNKAEQLSLLAKKQWRQFNEMALIEKTPTLSF